MNSSCIDQFVYTELLEICALYVGELDTFLLSVCKGPRIWLFCFSVCTFSICCYAQFEHVSYHY